MAKTYRVAVIGRTGKGNYGHGLDIVWKALSTTSRSSPSPTRTRRAAPPPPSGSRPRTPTPTTGRCWRRRRPQIVSVADRFLDAHRDMVRGLRPGRGQHLPGKADVPHAGRGRRDGRAPARRHHVKLAIAHQTRYSPRLQRVKELIAEGRLGDVLELRGRGKEDARGGGQDLMVLGTHIMDLMRFLAGDARWCFARVLPGRQAGDQGRRARGRRGHGPDRRRPHQRRPTASTRASLGNFGTHKAKARRRRALRPARSTARKGVIQLDHRQPAGRVTSSTTRPGSRARARRPGRRSPARASASRSRSRTAACGLGNVWIVKDLIEAIEKDRQPLGSMYDGRAALEMILAVYESHRLKGPVELPLKNRQHPLTML